MTKLIRVGLIRCDTHGAYYAALMAKHDPLKLQRPIDVDADPPYSWQNGVVHYYFYGFCADPRQRTVEAVDGFEVVKLWDEDRAAAEDLSRVLDGHPHVCNAFEETSEDVDLVFIADCNGDGSDHLTLAAPGLARGVPTYIDKPLANGVGEVEQILALARKHGAPLYSASILRHLPGAVQFRSRLPEIGRAESGCIRGGGCHIAGQIHTVSLAQAVFGNGIREVRAMGPGEMGVMFLSWGEREDRPPKGVVIHHNVREFYHCAMHVSAYGSQGAILDSGNINDWTFPRGAARILELPRELVRSGRPDDSVHDMIEAVCVVNAGRLSMREGSRAVAVEELPAP